MPQVIGLRIYKLYFTRPRGRNALNATELGATLLDLAKGFVSNYSALTQDDKLERSWYFEPTSSPPNHVGGLVQYGTYGFSSKILDVKSRTKKYDRLQSDVEQIPLFFDFWYPEDADYLLVALQSFGARSCVDLIKGAFLAFMQKQKDVYPRFKKLMPNDSRAGLFSGTPVKSLTFIARNTSSDAANHIAPYKPVEPVDITVSVRARKRGNLGPLDSVLGSVTNKEGLVEHEGVEFRQAFAEVRIKGRPMRVGVFGPMADTGAIDITEDVKFDDGHPTLASVSKQAYRILADFNDILVGL